MQQKKLVKKYEIGVKKMLLARRSLIQMLCGYSTLMPGKMYRVLATSTYRQPSTLSEYTVTPTPFFPFAGVPPSPRRYSEWKLTVTSLPLVHILPLRSETEHTFYKKVLKAGVIFCIWLVFRDFCCWRFCEERVERLILHVKPYYCLVR